MDSVDPVQKLVDRVVGDCAFNPEQACWLELAVMESVINAIQHGNRLDASKSVVLRIACSGDALEIIVEDEGAGFALDDLADPTAAPNLLKNCGRGISIIRGLMDDVTVSPRAEGGTRLRMVKRL